ncbi:hypothetical protein EKK58_02035 [Candidatus Dependentiae bacterium]|nr:MAG: hypothetical protein EKK58_02035 [Candidatus Dependentiae bacterium]
MSDYRAGIIASILCNVNRKKESPPFAPGDFFESLKVTERGKMTGAEIKEKAKMITAILSGTKKKGAR